MRRWPGARQLALETARIAAQRESYPEAARRYHAALAHAGPPRPSRWRSWPKRWWRSTFAAARDP